jgi:hypothetical protein
MNYQHFKPNFQINRTVKELMHEYNHTRDPMERFMIKNFIRIRSQQDTMTQRMKSETDSIESLSEEDKYDLDSEDSEEKPQKSGKRTKNIEELEELEKIKKNSMRELKKNKIDKIREDAYREMIDGDESDNEEYDNNDERDDRGQDHSRWRSEDLNDPKYAKYAKEDRLNNRMMERLNTEIDFRKEDNSRNNIVKPFDDGPGMNDDNFGEPLATKRKSVRKSRRRR